MAWLRKIVSKLKAWKRAADRACPAQIRWEID